MKRNKAELMNILKSLIGDDTSETSLSYIEDFTDSIDEENIDWRSKYDELDESWRRRYRDRFFENGKDEDVYVEDKTETESYSEFDDRNDITIDDLFKEDK